MKRNEIIEKLIQEGFSEKTLVKFSDNQINMLAQRIIGEQNDTNSDDTDETLMISKKSPSFQKDLESAKKQNKTIETYEEDLKSKNIEGKDKKEVNEEKPSAELSKEKKSEVVKKAKKGGDIGKKGKGFEKLADKAAKKYGSKESGKKVAAAAMWKNIHESNSDLNAKRNLQFELREAGVSDTDLESKDINKLAEIHSKNPNVKNAHEFYKRVSDKTMNIAGKINETKNWVRGLVENEKFHSFTSKNEIMELIQSKLNESAIATEHGSKVKKGHNGIPEFMTYDTLKGKEMGAPTTAPTKPKPTTKPGTTPKPKTPYQPGPGPNPNPKALHEKK